MTKHYSIQLFIKDGKRSTRRVVLETTNAAEADAEYLRRMEMYRHNKQVTIIRTKTSEPIG